MGKNIVQRVLESHLVEGEMTPGKEIAIKIDDVLLQDATGTLACLEFEEMGVPRAKTERTVIFIDHNTLQTDFMNRDDHKYLQSIAAKHGMLVSRTGNGICHQVWLERFARPGRTLLGSDSHTPTAGGAGQLGIGSGGLDVALAMADQPYHLIMPEVIQVRLLGELPAYVSAKDVVLKILEILGVKGGKDKALEYAGEGIKNLSVPERATITNMGTETGATVSIFPSDEQTLAFLETQGRKKDWQELKPDQDAHYEKTIIIFLDKLEPLVACPHSPDNVKKVSEIEGLKIEQVMIGSCTNSSLIDLKKSAHILKGQTIHPDLDLVIAPGSKQVLWHLAREGDLEAMLEAGARILECACGPCVGVGQAPGTKGVTLRTINRNFPGRSGTDDAEVYLVSPETAAVSAITGKLTDPRTMGKPFKIILGHKKFHIDDSRILKPAKDPEKVEIIRGPNIVKLPKFSAIAQDFKMKVLLKVEDNISTDDILPAGAKILPLRSNLPEIEKYTFSKVDPKFYERAIENRNKNGLGIVIGGQNYGQGSSREHAALAPRDLGVIAILVKSFARIHLANLINWGILPLEFIDEVDYDGIKQGDILEISDVRTNLTQGHLTIYDLTQNNHFVVKPILAGRREIEIIHAGGLLNWLREARI